MAAAVNIMKWLNSQLQHRMRVRYKRNHPKFIPILYNFDDSDLKPKEGKKVRKKTEKLKA